VAADSILSVEQRAPPAFGRAAITLGIGPHSIYCWSASIEMFNISLMVVAVNSEALAEFHYS